MKQRKKEDIDWFINFPQQLFQSLKQKVRDESCVEESAEAKVLWKSESRNFDSVSPILFPIY